MASRLRHKSEFPLSCVLRYLSVQTSVQKFFSIVLKPKYQSLQKMYNGVGLQTARGSGTNGYVQTNMAFIRKSRLETKVKNDEDIRVSENVFSKDAVLKITSQKMEAMLNKKPNQEILAHQAKRKVEVKVLELREAMEEDGNYDEEEIEVK